MQPKKHQRQKAGSIVWEKFVQQLTDPKGMLENILQGDFLSDHDREAQKDLLRKAEKDLAGLFEAIERTNKLFQWGKLSDSKYHQEDLQIGRMIQSKNDEITKLTAMLQYPKKLKQL